MDCWLTHMTAGWHTRLLADTHSCCGHTPSPRTYLTSVNSPHLKSLGESASCQASFSCLATDMFLTATPKDTTSQTLLHLVFPHTCPSNHCRRGQKVSASIPIMQFPCLGLVEADNPKHAVKGFQAWFSALCLNGDFTGPLQESTPQCHQE